MLDDMLRYTGDKEVAPRRDRSVARRAKNTYDEVRQSALMADGAMALGGHIMEGVMALDDHRRDLSGDAMTTALLMEIEATTVRQVKAIQNNLYSSWRL